jgi:hypothetical protein
MLGMFVTVIVVVRVRVIVVVTVPVIVVVPVVVRFGWVLLVDAASAGCAHSSHLHFLDAKLVAADDFEVRAAALAQRQRIRVVDRGAARAAAPARADFVDLDDGAVERRASRAHVEAKAHRVGHHRHAAPDLQAHAQNALVAQALAHHLYDRLGERELVHAGDLGQARVMSIRLD